MNSLHDYIQIVESERLDRPLLYQWTSPTQAVTALKNDKLTARRLDEDRHGSIWSTNAARPAKELVCLVLDRSKVDDRIGARAEGDVLHLKGDLEALKETLHEIWLMRSNQKNVAELADLAERAGIRVVQREEAP